jgi:hypothetical protein
VLKKRRIADFYRPGAAGQTCVEKNGGLPIFAGVRRLDDLGRREETFKWKS